MPFRRHTRIRAGMSWSKLNLEVRDEDTVACHRRGYPIIGNRQGIAAVRGIDDEVIRLSNRSRPIELDQYSRQRRGVHVRATDVNVSRKSGNGDE